MKGLTAISKKVQAHVQPSIRDLATYYLWAYQRTGIIYILLLLAGLGIWVGWRMDGFVGGFLAGAAAAIGFAFGPLNLVRFFEASTHASQYWTQRGGFDLTLRPEGLEIRHRHGDERMAWGGCSGVRRLPGILVIEVHQAAAIVIPLRDFASEDLRCVRDWCGMALGEDRVQWRLP